MTASGTNTNDAGEVKGKPVLVIGGTKGAVLALLTPRGAPAKLAQVRAA